MFSFIDFQCRVGGYLTALFINTAEEAMPHSMALVQECLGRNYIYTYISHLLTYANILCSITQQEARSTAFSFVLSVVLLH